MTNDVMLVSNSGRRDEFFSTLLEGGFFLRTVEQGVHLSIRGRVSFGLMEPGRGSGGGRIGGGILVSSETTVFTSGNGHVTDDVMSGPNSGRRGEEGVEMGEAFGFFRNNFFPGFNGHVTSDIMPLPNSWGRIEYFSTVEWGVILIVYS